MTIKTRRSEPRTAVIIIIIRLQPVAMAALPEILLLK